MVTFGAVSLDQHIFLMMKMPKKKRGAWFFVSTHRKKSRAEKVVRKLEKKGFKAVIQKGAPYTPYAGIYVVFKKSK